MSCLRPITIPNRAKTFGPGSVFNLTLPCGQCAECKKLIRDQWYLRSYWESRYTFDHGGYMLFDTLTYDDANIPRVSDFVPELKNSILDMPCFSYADIRRFMVDLRQKLSRDLKYPIKDKLKFFITAEYGHQTHRPHYHCLFYVTAPLDPVDLSLAISQCWKKGRTDGVAYQGSPYVMKRNVLGPQYDLDSKHLQNVCGYVAKYITKDDDYMLRLKNRLEIFFNRMAQNFYSGVDPDKVHYYDYVVSDELYHKALNCVKQFHRQSQHFGEYALSQSDIDDIMSTGMFELPDQDQIVKHIPMPLYYSRKLFCNQVKFEDGSRHWVLSELGKRYKYRRSYQAAAHTAQRFEDWFRNVPYTFILPEDDVKVGDRIVHFSGPECVQAGVEIQNRAKELLNGRSWLDLANYVVFYKGRVMRSVDEPLQSVGDMIQSDIANVNGSCLNMYRQVEFEDNEGLHKYVALTDTPDDIAWHRRHSVMVPELVSLKVFRKHMCINESTYEDFAGFDELLELIDQSQSYRSRRKQAAFDKVEHVRNLRKILNFS